MATQPSHHSKRLLAIACATTVLAAVGVALSFAYDVGAEPGSDPAGDIVLRGSAFAAPLFLPLLLLGASTLARSRRSVGAVGDALAILVGIAFLLGGTLNLSTDLDAARAAGAPTALSGALALTTACVGLALLVTGAGAFAARRRPGAELA